MNNKDFRVAVVGTGYWGSKHVAELKKLGKSVIAVDVNEENLEMMRLKFDVETSNDFEKILDDPSIQAITICTPNHTHFNLAKKALLKNKNVLLEKPLTIVPDEAWELVRLAEEKNKILAVGHIYRFNNAIKYAKDLIDSEKLGEIYLIKLTWTNFEKIFENRDILFDLAPHPFDIIDYLFNLQYDELYGIGNAFRKLEGEEAVFIQGKSNKTLINIELSWITPRKVREILIVGEHGSLVIDAVKQTLSRIEPNDFGVHEYSPEIIANNTIQDELNHFLNSVYEGHIYHADGKIGAKIVDLIQNVRDSLDTGNVNRKMVKNILSKK